MKAIAQSSFFWIFLGGLCYYLALPPTNFAPLALAVPFCWGMVLLLATEPKGLKRRVFLTAYLFWLASVSWVSYPHPPYTTIGLFVLSSVLALFWVLFFASARVAVHRFRVPLVIAMPTCWLGTEYIRYRILGGFSFCALEHAFYLYPPLIQLASIGGSLLLGGIIMFIGAAILTMLTKRSTWIQLGSALVFVCVMLMVSMLQIERSNLNDASKTRYSIVALQGNRQVYIDGGLTEANKTFEQFLEITQDEITRRIENEEPLPDLVVFPETVCPIPLFAFEGTIRIEDIVTDEEARYQYADARWFRQYAQGIRTPILIGLSTWVYGDSLDDAPLRLNSALFVQPPQGEEPSELLRYDKMHLVLLGEYVPFAEYLPSDFFLRTLCHEARHGTVPLAIPIGQEGQTINAAVNICFESTVAHLIRHQILTLRKDGREPRILINLSNDGWFRFSRAIDQHLATHVFRAVENRKYYVTATNGGFSAIISPYGEIRQIGGRGTAEAVSGVVSVDLSKPAERTVYQLVGDWYALPFAVMVVLLASLGYIAKRQKKDYTDTEESCAVA